MKKVLLSKFGIFYKKISEVIPACLLLMTKGDISAITLKHWEKAFSTGILTAFCMVVLSFIKNNQDFYKNKYLLSTLTAFVTMIVDFQMHPSHYQGNYTEALMTGFAAGAFCFIMSKFWDK